MVRSSWLSIVLFVVAVLSCSLVKAQTNGGDFKLRGTINVDTGTLKLYLVADSSYYPATVKPQSVKIKNGQFVIAGTIPYPIGVQLVGAKRNYQSGMFVIVPGNQSISVNVDSNRVKPIVDNAVMKEYSQQYLPYFSSVRTADADLKRYADSVNKVYKGSMPDSIKAEINKRTKANYHQSDLTLLRYVKDHPSSWYAFWHFVYLYQFGYEPVFDELSGSFDQVFKETVTGRQLYKNIHSDAASTTEKKPFPHVLATNASGSALHNDFYKDSRYTLVDFWYSNCSPCIAQFEELRALYKSYKGAGFGIVGLSTDKEKYRKNWLLAIKNHQLSWPQFWDKDGTEARRLSINSFPTNFLLDQSGTIVAKNMRPEDLRVFLEQKLKNK